MMKTNTEIKRSMTRKGLSRKLWVLVITALLVVGPLPAPRVHAATFTVDRTDDSASATACTGAPNDCSLRGAILKANAAAGADIIQLQSGQTYTLSLDMTVGNEDMAAEDDLDVTSAITIQGNGATIRRDPTPGCDLDGTTDMGEFRIFDVLSGGNLTLQNVTVTNGCADDWNGGGIWNGGTVTLTNSTISGNSAFFDGGGFLNDLWELRKM